MNLDMEDGRMIQLPDECSDEFARQLKRLILGTEERARTAEARAADVERRMAVLEARPAPEQKELDLTPLADAQRDGHAKTHALLQELISIAGADRHLMADEYGEHSVSRIKR